MPANIITTDDLREFKMELLDDIKNLLSKQATGKLKKVEAANASAARKANLIQSTSIALKKFGSKSPTL